MADPPKEITFAEFAEHILAPAAAATELKYKKDMEAAGYVFVNRKSGPYWRRKPNWKPFPDAPVGTFLRIKLP